MAQNPGITEHLKLINVGWAAFFMTKWTTLFTGVTHHLKNENRQQQTRKTRKTIKYQNGVKACQILRGKDGVDRRARRGVAERLNPGTSPDTGVVLCISITRQHKTGTLRRDLFVHSRSKPVDRSANVLCYIGWHSMLLSCTSGHYT